MKELIKKLKPISNKAFTSSSVSYSSLNSGTWSKALVKVMPISNGTNLDKRSTKLGLVKFDFLGLRTLTIIDWALQTINKKQAELNKPLVDITQIPRDDAA
jgi:hypothetical protein